jgi:hypothetical protein
MHNIGHILFCVPDHHELGAYSVISGDCIFFQTEEISHQVPPREPYGNTAPPRPPRVGRQINLGQCDQVRRTCGNCFRWEKQCERPTMSHSGRRATAHLPAAVYMGFGILIPLLFYTAIDPKDQISRLNGIYRSTQSLLRL